MPKIAFKCFNKISIKTEKFSDNEAYLVNKIVNYNGLLKNFNKLLFIEIRNMYI